MKKSVQLKNGDDRLDLPLSDRADILTISEPEKTVTEEGFAADLDAYLTGRSLAGQRVAVVVADKTRLCAYGRYLPVLLNRLEAKSAAATDITVYIAYGTHPAQNDKESRNAYGEVFDRYRFVHHDCTDGDCFADLGVTGRGTPVRFRKDILDADFVITFGAISHHYFAGYGGGRKLIFPGLGHREAIYGNHGLFLDAQTRTLSTGCRSGKLQGNPLAEDLAEIESHRPADLAIHGILDSHGTVCRIMVGSGTEHFLKACEAHGSNCEVAADHDYGMVVASCGGYPKDINFIQSHKAVHHAAAFVRDGGTLIVFAQCRDGVGSTTFLPWFDMGGWENAFDHLSRDYQGNGGTALAMMAKCRRINIFLVTDLPEDICRTIGAHHLSISAAEEMVRQHKDSLAFIPNASLLVRKG